MRIHLRGGNRFSIKIKKMQTKMAVSRPFSGKSPLTNFLTLTHQISLFAGLHTLSDLFHYKKKTKNNLFYNTEDFFTAFQISIKLE